VVASQQSDSFVDYTVSLASYDLFPTLAVQQGQTTLLNDPSQVEVYIDNSTQHLNTQALAPGSTLRFNGLVFNDNGTLRSGLRAGERWSDSNIAGEFCRRCAGLDTSGSP
jgi:hypothetical protein